MHWQLLVVLTLNELARGSSHCHHHDDSDHDSGDFSTGTRKSYHAFQEKPVGGCMSLVPLTMPVDSQSTGLGFKLSEAGPGSVQLELEIGFFFLTCFFFFFPLYKGRIA